MADNEKNKSQPLPWVILTGVLGMFAVAPPRPADNGPTPTPAEKKAAHAETPNRFASDDPLKPVRDFHASHDGNWDPADHLRDHAHGYDTEFLIATVPDPLDSPFGSAFDQVIEATQRAAERKDGYVLDRVWLPWELDKKARHKPDDANPPLALRDSSPGVLLFRRLADKARKLGRPGLLVVFLVGETPVGGIHKRAFTRSLQLMARAGHPADRPVRVLGPFFSGSQTSLEIAISDWWDGSVQPAVSLVGNPRYRFQVITGNASAFRKADFAELRPAPEAPAGLRLAAATSRLAVPVSRRATDGAPRTLPALDVPAAEFSATIVPTRLTVHALLHYLARRDGASCADGISTDLRELPGKVAIVTEANTSFGKQFASLEAEQLLVLRFPMHISRLRDESAVAFRKKDEQEGLKAGDLLVRSLADEPAAPGEGIPSQGGSATSAANGQVFESILSTVAREHCRYVGVVATDTKDKLFLIRVIREFCPDVHVFVTGSDVLLAHPEYRYHMRGVLVGSTYPLFPINQRWVKPVSGERNLFPTVYAQGYYNAALMHLGLPQHLLEYAPPPFATGDAPPEDITCRRPPIWISTVAPNGALVPLQVFTRYDDRAGYVRPGPLPGLDAVTGMPPLEYPGALLPAACGLMGLWGYLVFLAYVRRSPQFFWPVVRHAAGDLALPNVFYRNLVIGSQALLTLPVLAVAVTHARSNDWSVAGTLTTGFIGLAGLLLFAAMLEPLVRGEQRRELFGLGKLREYPADRWVWRGLLVLSFALVLAFGAWFLGRLFARGDDGGRVLFFVRAIDLGTGLSPLTPLFFVCLTFTAWGYFQLKRIHLADRYSVPSPFPEPQPNHPDEYRWFDRVRKIDGGLNQELGQVHFVSRHVKAIAAVVLGLALLGVGVWAQSLPTAEGRAWDRLFFGGFWVLFALTVLTLLHLFFLWAQTKKLLDSMALMPMMRALGRFPAKASAVFGKYLYTQRPHLSHLQVPAHHLRLLAAEAAADPGAPEELRELGAVADEVEAKLRDNLMAGRHTVQPYRVAWELRTTFSAVAARCLRALSAGWKGLAVDEAFGADEAGASEKAGKQPDGPREPAWVALAEGFVATQSVIYVSQFFVQLRNLVMAVMACSTLLLLAATSYPFHPERLLLVCLLTLMGAGVAAVLYVLVEMNRDEVVSRVSRTTPGRLSLDGGFVGSFLTYVVPALGILAAQLSGSFRWLAEPILRVLK